MEQPPPGHPTPADESPADKLQFDRTTLWQFLALIAALSWLSTIPVPGIEAP